MDVTQEIFDFSRPSFFVSLYPIDDFQSLLNSLHKKDFR